MHGRAAEIIFLFSRVVHKVQTVAPVLYVHVFVTVYTQLMNGTLVITIISQHLLYYLWQGKINIDK